MKLVHIISSLQSGGAEAILYDLITNEKMRMLEHHVIYFHAGPYVERLRKKGIAVYQVTGLLWRYDPFFCIRLFRLVKKIQPDCMHTLLWAANFFGRCIAQLLSIRCVSVFHNMANHNGLLRAVLDSIVGYRSTQLIAVSSAVAESICIHNQHIDRTSIVVIENGIAMDRILKKDEKSIITRQDLGLNDYDFVIGAVGRFVSVKRFDLLLEACALLSVQSDRTIRLVLLGFGPIENQLRAYARKLAISDQVVFVVGQQAYSYYRLFDCFVQSSDSEGLSLALLEAICFDVPVVATSSDTMHPVIITRKTGLIVPVGNAQSIADAILMYQNNEDLRRSVSKQARQTVFANYSLDKMVERYYQQFSKQG